jgi:hypothetical protein
LTADRSFGNSALLPEREEVPQMDKMTATPNRATAGRVACATIGAVPPLRVLGVA